MSEAKKYPTPAEARAQRAAERRVALAKAKAKAKTRDPALPPKSPAEKKPSTGAAVALRERIARELESRKPAAALPPEVPKTPRPTPPARPAPRPTAPAVKPKAPLFSAAEQQAIARASAAARASQTQNAQANARFNALKTRASAATVSQDAARKRILGI